MEKLFLLRSAFKKQIGSLIGIFVLIMLVCVSLFSSVTLLTSGNDAVSTEMNRLGYGTYTAWTNGNESELKSQIESLSDVEKVTAQPLIYAGYEINGKYSDNEGQLIVFDKSVPYRFLNEHYERTEIESVERGTIYISPALKSSYDIAVGGTIFFDIANGFSAKPFTVAGYFEDAFMGSSMIDMKSFLISETDREEILSVLNEAPDYERLAKSGAMMHIFQSSESSLSESEFHRLIQEKTDLAQYTEFSYTFDSILSYMLLLQNVLSGFLIAFSVVLLVVCVIVAGHSLSAVIEQNKKDMAILKTVGVSGGTHRLVYLLLYGGIILIGAAIGLLLSLPVSAVISSAMVTSTGMIISPVFPAWGIAILFGLVVLFAAFLLVRTAKIIKIAPIQTIRQDGEKKGAAHTPILPKGLGFSIALREVWSGKKRYIATCIISVLLVAFLSVVGKMGAWLGPNGEGLMNAFSVAEHDLGVQPFNSDVDMDEIERVVNWYSSGIKETYELAMQPVTVNGQSYTANALDKTEYFHVLKGSVCNENQILITDVVANELGVGIGDSVTVSGNRGRAAFTVSGIYMCANGMGTNIGMSREGYAKIANPNSFIWCVHYIFEDGNARNACMEYLQTHYRGIDVHTNSWSGLDGIVMLMHLLIIAIYVIAAVFIFVAVWLSASKLLQTETGNMAIYKSLGVSSGKLRLSFALRFLIVVAIGSILGTAVSAIFSDMLIASIFKMFGIGQFSSGFGFLGNLLPPIAVTLLFFGFAFLSSAKIKKASLVKLITENQN